jgi:hypothetical protein
MGPTFNESFLSAGKITGVLTVPDEADGPAFVDRQRQ